MELFKKSLRQLISCLLWIINIELIFSIAVKSCYLLSRLLFFRDWILMPSGRPQFFNHQLNIYQWIFEPRLWSFTARGVYPREMMFPGCKVLDLCCGNGSYSYLFFSDIAGRVDAIDKDTKALAYARKKFISDKINYLEVDVIKEKFPNNDYDFIIMNAAISYFDETQIHIILQKVATSGKASMVFFGMTPVSNRYADHKREFADSSELESLLGRYFEQVSIKVVDEGSGKSLYFKAASPHKEYDRGDLYEG